MEEASGERALTCSIKGEADGCQFSFIQLVSYRALAIAIVTNVATINIDRLPNTRKAIERGRASTCISAHFREAYPVIDFHLFWESTSLCDLVRTIAGWTPQRVRMRAVVPCVTGPCTRRALYEVSLRIELLHEDVHEVAKDAVAEV